MDTETLQLSAAYLVGVGTAAPDQMDGDHTVTRDELLSSLHEHQEPSDNAGSSDERLSYLLASRKLQAGDTHEETMRRLRIAFAKVGSPPIALAIHLRCAPQPKLHYRATNSQSSPSAGFHGGSRPPPRVCGGGHPRSFPNMGGEPAGGVEDAGGCRHGDPRYGDARRSSQEVAHDSACTLPSAGLVEVVSEECRHLAPMRPSMWPSVHTGHGKAATDAGISLSNESIGLGRFLVHPQPGRHMHR